MIRNSRFFSILAVCILAVFSITFAEAQENGEKYRNLIQSEISAVEKLPQNLQNDFVINSVSQNKASERTIVYVQHTVNGIPIEGAISIFAFNEEDDLKFKSVNKRLNSSLKADAFRLDERNAEKEALRFLSKEVDEIRENAPVFIDQPIKVKKLFKVENGLLRPIFKVEIFLKLEDVQIVTIDGNTSEVLDSYNKVLQCDSEGLGKPISRTAMSTTSSSAKSSGDYSYNVAPLPDINIIEKGRRVINNPVDTVASEIGWHYSEEELDEGPDNILEGNNIKVLLDRDGDFAKDDTVYTSSEGTFDYPLNLDEVPETYKEASLTQLFVVNNQIHDILYHNYFDEAAGNYQIRNFDHVDSFSNDPINVFGQSQADVPNGAINNAVFYPSEDGSEGYMAMYLWSTSQAGDLLVVEPAEISRRYVTGNATFTPSVSEMPVEGEVVQARDDVDNPIDACSELSNAANLEGKIALIERGECTFDDKVRRAEEAGAIGVIICNNEGDQVITMGGDDPATIPALMIGRSDCDTLKMNIDDLYVKMVPDTVDGTVIRDGALDNTIPVHEYGHGLSNRLVGGPSTADCLNNSEQMGEGWSDILALLLTLSDSNYTIEDRSIGSYAISNTINGRGIRNKLYSPDFQVNNYTYRDISFTGQSPHDLGEIWATVLWDLTQRLIEKEGFDEDLINGNGGNRTALQLINEGLKYTACNPGFIDGRDGILAADEALFDGQYKCMIWDVFAKRGLGYYAEQGSSGLRNDGKEDFHTNPYCDARIKVNKSVTQFAEAGDTIQVAWEVFNHNESTMENVELSDEIPLNATFLSSNGPNEVEYNEEKVEATIAEIAFNDTMYFSYSYELQDSVSSDRQFENRFESRDSFNQYFEGVSLIDDVVNINWNESAGTDNTGAVVINNSGNSNDQALTFTDPIEVNVENPMMIVEHKYNIGELINGGFIEYSLDRDNWYKADSSIIMGSYKNKVRSSFVPESYNFGYSGNQQDWSRVVIDLSQWQGQNIYFRFRLASSTADVGIWQIDALSYWERLSYNPEVCVTTSTSEDCFKADGYGTIVLGNYAPLDTTTTSVNNAIKNEIAIMPQPFQDGFTVEIPSQLQKNVTDITIYSIQGNIIKRIEKPSERLYIDASRWSSGLYLMKINTDKKSYTRKLLKN